jgi:hypothetical protein
MGRLIDTAGRELRWLGQAGSALRLGLPRVPEVMSGCPTQGFAAVNSGAAATWSSR